MTSFLYKINNVLGEICKERRLGSSEQDYMLMYAIARGFQVKNVLEIGTHQGGSAIVWCQAILDNSLIPDIKTIDLWCGCGNITKNYKEDAKKNIKNAGYDKYIQFIEGNSLIEVPRILDSGFEPDLCFIDGNHDVNYVLEDYNNCKKYCNLLIFHDTKFGEQVYLETIRNEGWSIFSIPTRYIEGDKHLVGISIAIRK